MDSPFQYKNISVSYSVSGSGSAVVLIHGFLENKTMWKTVSLELAKKYKVITIDLLGHGNTESLGYIHTMENQAEMVKAVLNNLKLRKYVLVGHSMGGYISLAFAKKFPQNLKGLCLMNSSALPDTKEKVENRDRAIKAVKENYKTFVKVAVPMLFSEENRKNLTHEVKSVTAEALKLKPQGIIAALEGMKIRKNHTDIYKEVNIPIQMIIGKKDPALNYNSLISQTKNTKVNVVEFEDGHMSHIENTTELITALKSFLKECL